VELDGPRLECPVPRHVHSVLTQVGLIELVWRTVEMLGEPLDGLDVVLDGGRGVVTPLELLQRRLSKMGQSNLLVTRTLPDLLGWSSAPDA
jgi:hypothetical protein